jgi:membrane associated rhomboid family serine protease
MQLSTTVIIVIITCLVSFTAFYNGEEMNKMILWPALIRERKQYYRFITSGFIHADLMHLAFNMITLYYFGRIVEVYFRQLFGPGIFVLFYLLSMVVADIQTYVKYRNDYSYRALGASGAVSAVLFASILFNPWAKIYLFFIPIGIPAFIFGILYLGFCIYMARRGGDNINHTAHLWGAVFGILFTIALEPRVATFFLQQLTAG